MNEPNTNHDYSDFNAFRGIGVCRTTHKASELRHGLANAFNGKREGGA